MADIYTLLDRDGHAFRVMMFSPPEGRKRSVRVVILPGANCDAVRYRWLADSLASEGATVLCPDPPLVEHPSPADPTVKREAAYVTVDQLVKTLAMPWSDDGEDELTFLIGHSLGGSVLLEYLDPAEAMADPRSGVGAGYKTPVKIDGGIVVGSSMQADVMGASIPWRSNDRPLHKPEGLPLLFVAGENDGLATPETVAATVARYAAPTALVVQKGANHFGWADGEDARDLRSLDKSAALKPEEQKSGLLKFAAVFMSTIADERADRIANALRDVAADGDAVEVR